MVASRLIATSFALALAAASAFAQQVPSTPASGAEGTGMMSHDCAKSATKHNHGADRGMPTAQAAPCAAAAASGAKKKSHLKHDHAKFHKGQA